MRLLVACLIISLFTTGNLARAQTNFYDYVNQLWLSGQKEAVLSIAQQRIQQNPNDIPGLLLQLEYQLDHYDVGNIPNTAARLIELGSTITTKNFRGYFRELKVYCEVMAAFARNLQQDPEELAKERAKMGFPEMLLGSAIKALQDDGYFNP